MIRLSPFALVVYLLTISTAQAAPVDYSKEIRPLLANSCWACHGPDEAQRESELRLDLREEAIKKAIQPGKASESPLFKRITSENEEKFMPPRHSKKPALTKPQIELVRRWIDEGAKFDQHWAYAKPLPQAVPTVKTDEWVRNPIDAFILAALEKQGLAPAKEADRATLIRRLSLDLLGLPPRAEQVEAFLKDTSANAYEKLVDQLLGSEQFGERMAVFWLDAVRYADTAGYHSDNHRDVHLYRDWVIGAYNRNLPFDQFTIHQIAGDLVPNATVQSRIASGYNRLLQTTEEGGAQAKEYTAKYAADRVRNTASIWLGSTMGCCECHNHKYDPFTTQDFYRFAAFFADVRETPVGRQQQTQLPTPDQEKALKALDERINALKAKINEPSKEIDAEQPAWEEKILKDGFQGIPKPVADALKTATEKRTDAMKKAIADHYRTVTPRLDAVRKELAKVEAERTELNKSIPTTLVSMTGPPRMTRVLPRGNWLDDSGEVVTPNAPAFLVSLEKKGAKEKPTRLDLANWFVSADNPLVSRVYVNRLWKLVFGHGIVRSLEDFGTQGTLPTHPELLDYLATEFVAQKWDTKAMLKRMVMSNAYRQSSVASKEVRERDPSNQWLARQNRFRIEAEFVRDNALSISGLLSSKVGGPSVKPYQPSGYWAYLNFPTRDWSAEKGTDQYRRGLYTYWCRSFLHPSLAAFDAPSREECTVERPRSSTPLQALVLLNDPTYVEASRVFAEKILQRGGETFEAKIQFAYRRAISRDARPEELKLLSELMEKHRKEFATDKASAEKLLGVGLAPRVANLDPVELAAWTSLARVILNLHETVTRN